jgi:hypothetical protein
MSWRQTRQQGSKATRQQGSKAERQKLNGAVVQETYEELQNS